jgi:flagellar biogenesis protein FliO
MFGRRFPTGGSSKGKSETRFLGKNLVSKSLWWPLVFVFGLGLLLLFQGTQKDAARSVQSATPPASLSGNASLPAAADGPPPSGEGETQSLFLPEYDPDEGLFSDTGAEEPKLAALPDDQSLLGSGEPTLKDAEPMGWTQVLLLAAKLLLVIGLVYAALAGLRWLQRLDKRMGKRMGQAVGDDTTIRVLETTGLAPGRALHLVVVGEKTLLIGATDHQLSLLAELSNETAPGRPESHMPDEVSINPDEAGRFDEVLSQGMQSLAEAEKPGLSSASPMGDWKAALNSVRAGMRRIRETVGD